MRSISGRCQEFGAAMESRTAGQTESLSAELRSHLEKCEHCRALYQLERLGTPAPGPSRDVEESVISAITASLKPVSPLRSWRWTAAAILVAFAVLIAAVVQVMRPAGAEAMSTGQLVLVSAVLAMGLFVLARALAVEMRPGSEGWLSGKQAVLFPGVFFALATGLAFQWRMSDDYIARGLHCLEVGLLFAALGAAVLMALIRRGALLQPGVAGASVGATGGWLAVAVLQYTCQFQTAAHLLVWHGAVLAGTTFVGAVVGESIGRARQRAM